MESIQQTSYFEGSARDGFARRPVSVIMEARGARVYDVIIVGAGPAGLNAALVLGRCRRRVLVCDAGLPRNRASHALHGFLTRDGTEPLELLRLGREELGRYGVELRNAVVHDACRNTRGFEVVLEDGTCVEARMLLLATGVIDELPQVEGVRELYGTSVFHCPYCDGWEMRDRPLAVYGRGRNGARLALGLKTWSADIVLCSDGPARLRAGDTGRLARHGIAVREDPIVRVEGRDGILERIVFASGEPLPRRGLFFSTGNFQKSRLPLRLGCEFTEKGAVRTNRAQGTAVPGLYVAGDAARDVHFAVVAAAEGAKAAVAINKALQEEESR
jgi:thioredoxin reductase